MTNQPEYQRIVTDQEAEAKRCNDEWMASSCPVCGQRLGVHKTVVGFIGKGCPDTSTGVE
jgi:hypothetical protein